jgi:putative membrane protein
MRRSLAIATVIATALFLPAAVNAAELPTADMEFVKQATSASTAEVELGKLGVEKASDQTVRQFAQRMVDDHGKANEELTKILGEKQVEIPKDLPPDSTAAKEQLSALTGADFDREFMAHMVSGHEKAVELFSTQADSGEDPDLKQFAEKTLPTVRDHLQRAQQIDAGLQQVAGSEAPEQQVAPAAGGNTQDADAQTAADAMEQPASTQEAALPPSPLGSMTAEQLIGQTVVNKNGEEVGTIDDIVLNSSDQAVWAIVSVGGFFGIADKEVAVPFEQLEPGENEAILMSSATEEQLKSLPEYKEGESGYTPVPRDQPIQGSP